MSSQTHSYSSQESELSDATQNVVAFDEPVPGDLVTPSRTEIHELPSQKTENVVITPRLDRDKLELARADEPLDFIAVFAIYLCAFLGLSTLTFIVIYIYRVLKRKYESLQEQAGEGPSERDLENACDSSSRISLAAKPEGSGQVE